MPLLPVQIPTPVRARRLARSLGTPLLRLMLVATAPAACLVIAPAVAHADDGAAKAQRAFKAADYETALREYRALAKDKADPEVLMQIARCLDRLLRSNDAIVAYQHALHSGASTAQAKEARDRMVFLREFLARGATREQLAANHIERGAALYKLELYREARTEFDGAVRALPDKPNGYRWLGLTLERMGECKQAIGDFETFLSIVASDDPRADEVNQGIKRCSARLGGGSSATAGARPVGDEQLGPRATEREKKVKEHLDRGADLFAAGRFKEAREEFAIARTLAPEKATPFRWLGLVDALLDRCNDAVQNLDVFLKRVPANDPRVPEVEEVMASCRDKLAGASSSGSRAGSESAAAAPSAKPAAPAKAPAPAPASDPESRVRVLIEKGTGLYHAGNYREARDAFEEARAVMPDRANAYRWLGLAEARLGHCKEAIASFDTFIGRVSADDDRITEVARVRGRCAREMGGAGTAVASSTPAKAEPPRAGARVVDLTQPEAPRPVDPEAPRSSAPPPPPPDASAVPGQPEPPGAGSPPPRSRVPSYTVPVVVGVGALALVGAGAGVTVWGRAQYNTLAATCAPNCLPAEANAVRNKLYAGYALMGVGGLAAVGDAVLWYFWWRNHVRDAPHASIAPSGDGASLVVTGTF